MPPITSQGSPIMRKRAPNKTRRVSCVICRALFDTAHSQGKYCSPDCQAEGARASWRKYGEQNREKRREYHREFYEKNKEMIIQKTKEYQKTGAGKQAAKINYARQREKHPEKIAARQAVLIALRAGKIKKEPCTKCGNAKVQAHHQDYATPLSVVWLCDPCHRAEHGKIGIVMEDGTVSNPQPTE